jgi:phosphatidyl-myo-inositol dimannoside synthase
LPPRPRAATAPESDGLMRSHRTGTSSRPRLVIVTTDCPPELGGIQEVLHELATGLAARWAVTVIAPHNPSATEYDRDASFRIVRTAASWRDARLRFLAETTRLAAAMPGDVYLAAHVVALMPLAMSHPRARRVVLLYGSELWAPASRLVARVLAARADRVMAISRFTAAEAEKIGIASDKIVVTPLGATLPPNLGADDEVLERLGLLRDSSTCPFFLTVSRLAEPHKGQDVFLRALPEILAQHPAVRYVIAGEGPLAPDLLQLATDLGVRHAVCMPGAITQAEKGALMRGCRAYVMLSRESRKPALFEGFGIAYLEAARAGRPSLAGDSGGVRDAVVHGRTGLVLNPLSAEAAADAAIRVLDDPSYADALGEAARERAESEFTWDAAVERMERVLLEALP